MNSIHFLVLNMKKNVDRLINITDSLNKINCNYTIVEAIDGSNMENNDDAKFILKPIPNLIGSVFKSIDTKKKWIYDGTILKSFPNLNLYGHYGTKGLTISNIKAFYISLKLNYVWFCILEDDAEININIYNKILSFINNKDNINCDVVLLDNRSNGFGGTSGVLYNKRIIKQLIYDLHPLSKFSIFSDKLGDKNLSNLWDWKLFKYLKYINRNFKTLPCIPSGRFESTLI
jgi:hypothetical protein